MCITGGALCWSVPAHRLACTPFTQLDNLMWMKGNRSGANQYAKTTQHLIPDTSSILTGETRLGVSKVPNRNIHWGLGVLPTHLLEIAPWPSENWSSVL